MGGGKRGGKRGEGSGGRETGGSGGGKRGVVGGGWDPGSSKAYERATRPINGRVCPYTFSQ